MRSKKIVIGPGKSRHNETSKIASRGTKTYGKNRIELRNLQNLKKMLKRDVSFCHKEQPSEPTSMDVILNIAGVEKISSKNLRMLMRSTLEAIWFEFWMKGVLVM